MDIDKVRERFSGQDYLETYHRYRPRPPIDIATRALDILGQPRAGLVADIGSGTGISSALWAGHANAVVGIEPSQDMRAFAIAHLPEAAANVSFVDGVGHKLPFNTGSVDLVSCGQALHWMSLQATLVEIGRALRPGGVCVVFDCAWPPRFHALAEEAYVGLFKSVAAVAEGFNSEIAIGHMKSMHKQHLDECGVFRQVHEDTFSKIESGSPERLLGIALGQGGLRQLLKNGFTEQQVGLDTFRKSIAALGSDEAPMTFQYKVYFAVKT